MDISVLSERSVAEDRSSLERQAKKIVDEKNASLDITNVELRPFTSNLSPDFDTAARLKRLDGTGVEQEDQKICSRQAYASIKPTIVPSPENGGGSGQGVQEIFVANTSRGGTPISSTNSIEDEDYDTMTPLTSTQPSECGHSELVTDTFRSSRPATTAISELYAENIMAKALRTAQTAVGALPFAFPEIVVQGAGSDGIYTLREADFWTCGFFPGTLYLLLERLIKFPQSVQIDHLGICRRDLGSQLTTLCRMWSEPIRRMDTRTDTHDIGFIVMPALRMDWELFGNTQSLDSIVRAAKSLATRYVPGAKAIRSWDLLKKKDIEILDQTDNAIVIIDRSKPCSDGNGSRSYVAAVTPAPRAHVLVAERCIQGPVVLHMPCREHYPNTGELKCQLSAQGYANESTWSRGQAWGILGYAETYMWTKDCRFLEAACGLAEYFMYRLETAPPCVETKGRNVPLWDFDAPIEDEESPLRDSSAGMIAANGMLVLSQALTLLGQSTLSLRYRNAALIIVQDTLKFALAPEKARLVTAPYQHAQAEEEQSGVRFDGLLKYGTANNNAQARKRYANHGLVYGDYYLVEFGNRLLRMGLY